MWTKLTNTTRWILDFLRSFLSKRQYDESFINASLRSLPFVAGAILTAAAAVLYAQIFNVIEVLLHSIKTNVPWLFFIITPIALVTAWWIVQKYSKAAAGSGIPQVMAALNSKRDTKKIPAGYLLGRKAFLTKIVSSVVALLGGAVIGREGPTIQVSSSIFFMIHQILPKDWPKVDRSRMLIAGASAGLAAAFNTPLGGIVFAVEELAKSHLNSFKSSLLYAVIFSGMTAQWLLGPYLYLGYPKITVGGFSMIGYVILFSAITGIAGAYKAKIILKIVYWKRRLQTPRAHIIFIVLSGFALAAIIYFSKDVAYGPGKEVMNRILFEGQNEGSIWLILSRFFGAIISYCTGIAGGVFATSLSTGAAIGELLTGLMNLDKDNKVLILVSMIGFLTGLTRSPFTASILVLEMTDRHSAIFYFLLAGQIAALSARLVDRKSIYERLEGQFLH
ncbi:MAG: chloride channel protein [Bacteroidia bacterium]